MRRILAAGLTGMGFLIAAAASGCGPSEKVKVPEQSMELPKEGPAPVGGKDKSQGGQPGPGGQSASQ
jgi:hypothetical protein